jgi:hypothetical protein
MDHTGGGDRVHRLVQVAPGQLRKGGLDRSGVVRVMKTDTPEDVNGADDSERAHTESALPVIDQIEGLPWLHVRRPSKYTSVY